jgi:hypothetical protein
MAKLLNVTEQQVHNSNLTHAKNLSWIQSSFVTKILLI